MEEMKKEGAVSPRGDNSVKVHVTVVKPDGVMEEDYTSARGIIIATPIKGGTERAPIGTSIAVSGYLSQPETLMMGADVMQACMELIKEQQGGDLDEVLSGLFDKLEMVLSLTKDLTAVMAGWEMKDE